MSDLPGRLAALTSSLPVGLSARAAVLPADAPALAEITNAASQQVGNLIRETAGGIAEVLTTGQILPELDTAVVEDARGRLIAWASAERVTDTDKSCVFLFGSVHPAHQGRGIGRALFAWSKGRAQEILAEHPRGTIQMHLFGRDERAQRLCASEGARPIRWFSEMRLRFDEVGASALSAHEEGEASQHSPAGYQVQPFSAVDSQAIRKLHNHCFADHWGSFSFSESTWGDLLSGELARIELSEVITDSSNQLVAYQFTEEAPQDEATLGKLRWISKLGVHREHRGKGLATLLIKRHLERTRADGYEGSMLGVDSDSLTGAHRLYERIGYRHLQGSVRYILGDAEFS